MAHIHITFQAVEAKGSGQLSKEAYSKARGSLQNILKRPAAAPAIEDDPAADKDAPEQENEDDDIAASTTSQRSRKRVKTDVENAQAELKKELGKAHSMCYDAKVKATQLRQALIDAKFGY